MFASEKEEAKGARSEGRVEHDAVIYDAIDEKSTFQ
jgi:hypothetical protein